MAQYAHQQPHWPSRGAEPTGKDLVLDGSDAVRIDSDGMITDRWSGLSFAHLHWQLEQNAMRK